MSSDIKKGLLGVVVDESSISQVMPDINSLTYRGYVVQDLCEKCSFEEVAYLILNKELPNKMQLKKFEKKLKKNRNISSNLKEIIKHMPKKSHPMDVTRTVVSIMGLEDKETNNNSADANMRKAIRIFAKTPTAIAAFFRTRKGKNIIPPKTRLGFSENFFHMCFAKIPSKEIVKAFDVSLILYAEHSFNVSTFTARTITSSLSDIHSAITGAIGSLKGPLHGGANEEVLHMMNKIKKPEAAKKWINNSLNRKDVIMGFGHRVYKKGDSRVPTMEKYFKKVAKIKNDKKFRLIYDSIKNVMINRKDIHPNVDYPTGPTYHLMGFDTDFFTPIFVLSRITGWSAHVMEQHNKNKLIRPLAKYIGVKYRKVKLLNQR
jgi:2-methylcitrate synthase